ncbi:DUF998 domain-containing protein [Streptomyces puniciscabiei]
MRQTESGEVLLERAGLDSRVVAAVLLAVAALAYNDWLLQFFLPTGLDQRDSYVSELFAADQPYRALFATIEVACALLIAAAGLLAHRTFPSGAAGAGWAAVTVVGVCSVADVMLPLRCAPSVEQGCRQGNAWHTLTSGSVHFALFTSMALLIAASQRGAFRLGLVRRWGPWLLPLSMAAAIATVGPFLGCPGGHGIAQRIHLATAGAWFALLCVELSLGRRRG